MKKLTKAQEKRDIEFYSYLSKAFLKIHQGKLIPIEVVEKINEYIEYKLSRQKKDIIKELKKMETGLVTCDYFIDKAIEIVKKI